MMNILSDVLHALREDYPDLEYVTQVKSGKEATVHTVFAEGKHMALKVYRPNTKNAARGSYMTIGGLDKRSQRALVNRSRHGLKLERELWTNKEFEVLTQLNSLGAAVPGVYGTVENAVLMEFIGEGQAAAPRLADVKLDLETSKQVFQMLLDNIQLFCELDIVHGDLSPFNILVHNKRPVIIDFPQAMSLRKNPLARERLLRDLRNVFEYFEAQLQVEWGGVARKYEHYLDNVAY